MFPRRANVVSSIDDLTGKPALRRALTNKYSDEMVEMFGEDELDRGTSERTIRRRAEMLLAVDEGLGRIVDALDGLGILDETFIIFTSDVANPGSQIDELVVSVDIAPTVLDIAGVPIGDHIQGRSLVPLLRGNATDWRQSVLIEFYTYENPFPWLLDMDYRAIRTSRYKYIHWMQHPDENDW